MGDIDAPYAALLEDLARTGMLSETMVVLMGEFGRTPQINAARAATISRAGRACWRAAASRAAA